MDIETIFNATVPGGSYRDFDSYGQAFSADLAGLSTVTDVGREARSREWCYVAALLCTLIQDQGMTTEMAAFEAAMPVWLDRGCRNAIGI